MILTRLALATALIQPVPVLADVLQDEVIACMDFATDGAGIILADQLTHDIWPSVHFVDVRSASQHKAGTIPGAVNIGWREIPARLDELPQDGLVVLFCNTGARSSQATFAARLLGRENVVVLQSGYENWRASAPYRPD